MAASEETGGLFLIFVLTMIAIPLVPYTLVKLCRAAKEKAKSTHCECQLCVRLGKNQRSLYKRISNLSTYNNIMLLFLWIIMAVLVYYIRHSNREVEVFEPFNILGLDTGASDSEIKKAYRRLSIQYHPDKNPDPEAHKYFVEYISKAYQTLTDPISRENFEKYGHPDGRQGFQMGIALPQFLLNIDGSSGGVLLLGIVGVCILMPLVMAVIYLSRSSKYTGNYVMHYTQSTYYYCMKPSLAPSKVMDLFAKASEYMEIPVRREDEEPLKKLFVVVRSELNHDPKNVKQENTKFWKQHPAQVKTELLIQAHLTRKSEALSPSLLCDSRRVLELAPPLLEELIKIALVPRSSQGGWLRPAVGAIELSQSIVQAVPFSARKAAGGSADGAAPFLQLPHFTESMVKKITRRRVRMFQDLIEIGEAERSELLRSAAGMSAAQVRDVEAVLGMIPAVSVDVAFETEGEEGGIQEGDVVTMHAWVSLRRANGAVAAVPHAPHFPFHKEENFWILLSNSATNDVWLSQKISFSDEDAAAAAVSKAVQDSREGSGASPREIKAAVLDAVARVRAGSRLVMAKFQAPREGAYTLVSHCLCDSWIGCDRRSPVKIKVLKRTSAAVRSAPAVDEGAESAAESQDDHDGAHNYDDDYESEYSDDDDGAATDDNNSNNSNNVKKANGCPPAAPSGSDVSDY